MPVRMVVARRPDGLGTRLACLVCAKQLADHLGVAFKVIWPAMVDHGYDYSLGLLQEGSEAAVFSRGGIFGPGSDDTFTAPEHLASLATFQVSSRFWPDNRVQSDHLSRLLSDYDCILYDIPAPLYVEGVDDAAVERGVKDAWSGISFNPAVADLLDPPAGGGIPASDVALHLRRGDMESMLLERDVDFLKSSGMTIVFQRYLPLETAVLMVETHARPGDDVLVCSEDRSAKSRIADRLPSMSIRDTADTFPMGSNERALIDILVLSRAKTLLAPYRSFFSECAALVGSCSLVRSPLHFRPLTDELEGIVVASGVPDGRERLRVLYELAVANLGPSDEHGFRAEVTDRLAKLDAGC